MRRLLLHRIRPPEAVAGIRSRAGSPGGVHGLLPAGSEGISQSAILKHRSRCRAGTRPLEVIIDRNRPKPQAKPVGRCPVRSPLGDPSEPGGVVPGITPSSSIPAAPARSYPTPKRTRPVPHTGSASAAARGPASIRQRPHPCGHDRTRLPQPTAQGPMSTSMRARPCRGASPTICRSCAGSKSTSGRSSEHGIDIGAIGAGQWRNVLAGAHRPRDCRQQPE